MTSGLTRAEFDELVREIERRFADRRKSLRFWTVVWVLCGLAIIVAWFLCWIAVGASLFVLGLYLGPGASAAVIIIGILLFLYGCSQAMLFLLADQRPPDGRMLRESEGSELRRVIDELSLKLKGSKFDQIYFSMELNASVVEIPRFGLFGWNRSYLHLGLPLLTVLSQAEFRAVLAHEMAHRSAKHLRSSGWIYRLHRTWGSIIEGFQRPAVGSFDRLRRAATSKFLDWYWPRFHARAFVLSRFHEYEADGLAASAESPTALADSLWRLQCYEPWMQEQFWEPLWSNTAGEPNPPDDIHDRMRRWLQTSPDADRSRFWMLRALRRPTDNDDTHPAFFERALALGESKQDLEQRVFPPSTDSSAVDSSLGTDGQAVIRDVVEEWTRQSRAAWHDRLRRAAALRQKQATEADQVNEVIENAEVAVTPTSSTPLSEQPSIRNVEAMSPASAAMKWEEACRIADLRGDEAAEPLLRELAESAGHNGARARLGAYLLQRGRSEGVAQLNAVIEEGDPRWFGPACQVLEGYYLGLGQTNELKEIRRQLDAFEKSSVEGRKERTAISVGDMFHRPELTAAETSLLHQSLAPFADCRVAWLGEKVLRHFPKRRLFVLVVGTKVGKRAGADEPALAAKLVGKAAVPGQMLIVGRTGPFARLADRVIQIAGHPIYVREEV